MRPITTKDKKKVGVDHIKKLFRKGLKGLISRGRGISRECRLS